MAARLSRAGARVWLTLPIVCRGWPVVLVLLALGGCQAPTRELTELIVQDSTYLDPETMLPFSGRVFRDFSGTGGGRQLDATMRDGTWEGELTVFHEGGRIRYQGEMSGGARCGAWVENENPTEPESVYEAIKEDLESLVMYPECPDG